MGILTRTVKASTIIEVLVAMVIIMVSAGLGLIIYENLSRVPNDELRIKAELALDYLGEQTKRSANYTNLTQQLDGMQIKQTILSFSNHNRLKIMRMEAFTPIGKKITSWSEIIITP